MEDDDRSFAFILILFFIWDQNQKKYNESDHPPFFFAIFTIWEKLLQKKLTFSNIKKKYLY